SRRRKKGPDSASEAQGCSEKRSRIVRRRSSCRRLQGLSYTAHSGSRGIVARAGPASNANKPQEAAFSRLESDAVEIGPRDVVPGDRVSVQLDPALVDRPPPVARRLAELRREECRQV